jgi:PAS domain S-box-containing protein
MGRRLAGFETGSRVEVVGVCVLSAASPPGPRRFEVLLRSPADVTSIARAPLSRAAMIRVAAVLAAALAAFGAWLALLRRRVARQTETIRGQFERAASLEKRYAELVEHASDPMYIRDLEGNFLQVNRGTEEVSGYSRAELLRMTVFDLVAPADLERARLNVASPRDVVEPVEWRIRTRQGSERVIEIKARVLREDGRPARVECIGRDVTARTEAETKSASERRGLEEQLQQAQKMESIGLLAGGVAHDFNNLLTVIAGYAQMAREEAPEGHPARESIDEIVQAADRATALTRQLLMFSRRRMTDPKAVSLNELVVNLEKMLRRLIGEDIELTLSPAARDGTTRADEGHLEQVVMNLAVNARDAMSGGGKLSIETADVDAGEEDGVAPGRYIELRVRDTGAGMTREVRDRIFEPFFTTKEKGKGTGLGLSMVYGIVKQSGGAVSVESEPGRGSTFRVLLPAAEPDAASEEGARASVSDVRGTETILLVEDEEGVRRYVSSVLRNNGYLVLEARNGSEALELAGRHDGAIDLLLSDVVMPEMGGLDLAEQFRAAKPKAAVVLMTGYTDRPLPPERLAGALMKPFTPAELLSRVRQGLRERRGRS